MRSRLVIGCVLVSCLLLAWVFSNLYQELLDIYEHTEVLIDSDYSWCFRLLLNLVGYSTILVPGYLLYKYLHKTQYFDKITKHTWVSRLLLTCFGEPGERLPEAAKPPRAEGRECLELVFCFGGLMAAYLVWGLLQEKIMTQNYVMADGSLVRFDDSQLLVFVNRLLAFALAVGRLAWRGRPVLVAPLYNFCYCALTNIISAWCQYEALKFVSFPTQVLSKSCKVIPVMLMGKLISRNKYEPYEYLTALLISLGMALFMFGSHDDYAVSAATTGSGLALLALYMACDSFTSSWQAALFARHSPRPLQMLAAVNLCSLALTAAALPRPTAPRARARLTLLQVPPPPPPGVRDGLPAAVAELRRGADAHLPHHRTLRRRRLHHHHDAETGGVHPGVVRGVRARGVRAGRLRRAAGLRRGAAAPLLPRPPRALRLAHRTPHHAPHRPPHRPAARVAAGRAAQ